MYDIYKQNIDVFQTDSGEKKTLDIDTGKWYNGDEMITNAIHTVSKLIKSELAAISDQSKLVNIALDNIIKDV